MGIDFWVAPFSCTHAGTAHNQVGIQVHAGTQLPRTQILKGKGTLPSLQAHAVPPTYPQKSRACCLTVYFVSTAFSLSLAGPKARREELKGPVTTAADGFVCVCVCTRMCMGVQQCRRSGKTGLFEQPDSTFIDYVPAGCHLGSRENETWALPSGALHLGEK